MDTPFQSYKDNDFSGKYILYLGVSNTENKNILDHFQPI